MYENLTYTWFFILRISVKKFGIVHQSAKSLRRQGEGAITNISRATFSFYFALTGILFNHLI